MDPDGNVFWIDYRPLPASWEDPRSSPNEALPDGVQRYVTPAGRPFFVDSRPRLSWAPPEGYSDDADQGVPAGMGAPSLVASTFMPQRMDTDRTKVPSAPGSRRPTHSPSTQCKE